MLKFRLFGSLTVEQDERRLPLPASAQARDLLAYLVLFHDRRHNRSALAGTFWPDQAEERARRALSQALWHIRRLFPDLLTAEAETVGVAPQTVVWVDAEVFGQSVERALHAALPEETVRRELQSALELYCADFLEGNYHDWALFEREHLRALYLLGLERMEAWEKIAGRYHAALDLARCLARTEPLDESAHREVMRLYHLLGQPQAALRQFDQCCRILRQELGVEPDSLTLALAKEIGYQVEKGAPAMATAPQRESLTPAPLIGRTADRSALLGHLEATFKGRGGLVLLEGEAGVGKTRLLQEIALEAEWHGAQVLWGHARENQELKPYAPLVEAMQSGLTSLRMAQIQQVIERIWLQVARPLFLPHPAWAALESAPSVSPEQEGARLSEALLRLLEAWSEIMPLMVLLEDLHWADQDTLALLPALSYRAKSRPLLTVCS